ncbi:ATP-binding protein, partial [Dehalococcoidia bacterium]|nr:ATP-binding protein [Dehalococcoidia bacterium]
MIKLLKLKNFRSIGEKELSLTLRPLTILVGPSGSGKSSILYFIDWLATKVTDPAIEGLVPQVKAIYGVTSFSDLIHACKPEEKELDWSLRIQLSRSEITELENRVEEIDWALLGFEKPTIDTLGYEVRYKKVRSRPDYFEYNLKLLIDNQRILDFTQEYKGGDYHTRLSQPPKVKPKMGTGKVLHIFQASDILSYRLENVSEWEGIEDKPENRDKLRMFSMFCKELEEILRNKLGQVHLLSALRGAVEGSAQLPTLDRVGRRGEDTLRVLGDLITSDRIERTKKANDLMFWCSVFGLRDIVAGIAKGTTTLGSHYKDEWSGLELSLPCASQGSLQVLTIIAQLLAVEPGGVILIEEPELSLHPEYQTRLPILFADAIKNRGWQIIITTHSSFVILALARAIAGFKRKGQILGGWEEREFKLDLSNIAIYHIDRTPEEGVTR